MKKFTIVLVTLIITVMVTFSLTSCEKGEGIPFLSTKSKTTLPPNTVTVTFPEGYTVIEIAERLEKNNVCSADAFLEECKKPYDGIEIKNPQERIFLLEGYIFPDTYEFYFNSDPKSVVDKFIENYNTKVTDEIKAKAKALGYTMDEMLTLASVIQKECDHGPQECANVSSVFHNRLSRPGFPLLQSDVTTFYITRQVSGVVGYKEGVPYDEQDAGVKKYMELYSTYYRQGLPAGPICNPGIKAITAAVNPADTDYVYFLTDEKGEKFYYARTLAEHQSNGIKAGLF